MEINLLRQKFLAHFAAEGYKTLPAASLIPVNDPSVLFTTAGMQQFKTYYVDPSLAPAAHIINIQPVTRTGDIAEVGDDTHFTMFEMLGVFRFGEKSSLEMKRRALNEAWQFLTVELGLEPKRFEFNIFSGTKQIPADTESEQVLGELGAKIKKSIDGTFWGPTGDQGPCGPAPEVYVDGIEIGTIVFNQYYQTLEKDFKPLAEVGLDIGYGLERLAATIQGKSSTWQISPFADWVRLVGGEQKTARIIIDHLKASVFLMSAGVLPGNKGRDYILRRLLRKAIFLASELEQPVDWSKILREIRSFYAAHYSLLPGEELLAILTKEKEQFERNLSSAQRHLERWLTEHTERDVRQVTELAFYMYESFGFPKELVLEYLQNLGWRVDYDLFAKLFARHQEVSRAGLGGQFTGGLADHEPQTIKHHTAQHLLLAALQQVLGERIVQKGSNITSERLRLDFNFDRKLTDDELKKVTMIVNEKIKEKLPVAKEELPKEQAIVSGAQAEFGQKYGELVMVYTIKNPDGSVFSCELCGGPHVANTSELGHFTILKEEASGQGLRRIKAKVE